MSAPAVARLAGVAAASVNFQRQCLDRRLSDRATLQREVAAWTVTRNAAGTTVDWRVTTADARIKLKRLYPAYEP